MWKFIPEYKSSHKVEKHGREYSITRTVKFKWLWIDVTSVKTYLGECTVWHELPSMTRPGTEMEGHLCSVLEAYLKSDLIKKLLSSNG